MIYEKRFLYKFNCKIYYETFSVFQLLRFKFENGHKNTSRRIW